MRRHAAVLLVTVLTTASVACGDKKPPIVAPTPLPAPSAPRLLPARPLDRVAPGWPPEPAPVPVADLLRELPEPAPPPPPERVPEAAPPVPPPVAEPPRLTTPETPDAAEATRQVRESLTRARRALAALRYERLSADARTQYDTVTQLIQQAEDALRTRDFVFALKVADKAETLARRLSGLASGRLPSP